MQWDADGKAVDEAATISGSHLQRSIKQYKCEGWRDGTVGLAPLPQSLNLVLNMHGEQLTTACTLAPGDQTPSSGFCGLCIHGILTHTHKHTYIQRQKKSLKKLIHRQERSIHL